MGEIKVEHAAMEAAVQTLEAGVKEIDGILNDLEGRINKMRQTFSGQARGAYESAQSKWDQAIAEMQSALGAAGRFVSDSHAAMNDADKRGAAGFGG